MKIYLYIHSVHSFIHIYLFIYLFIPLPTYLFVSDSVSVFAYLQVKISQDGNSSPSTKNGVSNGNSQARGNPDREEEGEDTGKLAPRHRGGGGGEFKTHQNKV